MLIRLQQRRGTTEQWTSANTVLAAGEMAISTDDQTFKIGDGTTAWSDLPYFVNLTDITSAGLQVLGAANQYTDGVVGVATTSLSEAITSSATAQQTYTDGQIAALVDSAPETLNTLNEIATALQSNDGDINTITTILGTKSDIGHSHNLDDLTNVDVLSATDQQVVYFDDASSSWKAKDLAGIDALTVTTTVPSNGGELLYNTATGEFTFTPAITGVTAGSYAKLEAIGPFAASTGGFYPYNDGSQNLSVTLTTTIAYTNLISLTADHICTSYAAAKLFRIVGGVETEIFNWDIIIGKDFSWTIYDEHNLEPGTEITYLLKGQGTSATTYIGQNSDVQLWVQEVAGALGGQPTSPSISVTTATPGTSTGGLSYTDGVLTYTPVLPAAAALSELTDVDLTALGDADVLAYDAASNTWLPGSAASSVAQLSDVSLNGLVDQSMLTYTAPTGKWEANPVDIAPSLVSFIEKTANYTLQLSDKDKMIEVNSQSAVTITVPSTVSWVAGTTISIIQGASGQVTIVGSGNTSLRYTPSNILRTQFSSATLIYRGNSIWYLSGDLA